MPDEKKEAMMGPNVRESVVKPEKETGPEQPKKSDAELEEEMKKEKAAFLEQATEVLRKYKMKESDIPITSNYWDLMNKYRALP